MTALAFFPTNKKNDRLVIRKCWTQPGVMQVRDGREGSDEGVCGRRRRRQWDETLTGWSYTRWENQYYITLFTRHHSQLSCHATVSFSPLQKVFVNNLNLNVLFCFLSICSEASNDNPPSKRYQLMTVYLQYVQIKQNLRTMLDNRLLRNDANITWSNLQWWYFQKQYSIITAPGADGTSE